MVETLGRPQRAARLSPAQGHWQHPGQQHWPLVWVCVGPALAYTDVIFSNGSLEQWLGVLLAGALPPLAGFLMLADRDLSNGLGAGGDGAQVELLVGEKDDKKYTLNSVWWKFSRWLKSDMNKTKYFMLLIDENFKDERLKTMKVSIQTLNVIMQYCWGQ